MPPKKGITIRHIFFPKDRVLLLNTFCTVGDKWLDVSNIAKLAKLPPNFIKYDLEFFVESKILQKRSKGKGDEYRMRFEDPKVRALQELFDVWSKSSDNTNLEI